MRRRRISIFVKPFWSIPVSVMFIVLLIMFFCIIRASGNELAPSVAELESKIRYLQSRGLDTDFSLGTRFDNDSGFKHQLLCRGDIERGSHFRFARTFNGFLFISEIVPPPEYYKDYCKKQIENEIDNRTLAGFWVEKKPEAFAREFASEIILKLVMVVSMNSSDKTEFVYRSITRPEEWKIKSFGSVSLLGWFDMVSADIDLTINLVALKKDGAWSPQVSGFKVTRYPK